MYPDRSATISAEFEAIDRQIEDLQSRVDTCQQAMTLSRAALVGAGIVLAAVLTVAGIYRTPTVVFSAIAVMIGGTVWLGASKSSLDEARDELLALDAVKNRMIDKVAAENGWRDLTTTRH